MCHFSKVVIILCRVCRWNVSELHHHKPSSPESSKKRREKDETLPVIPERPIMHQRKRTQRLQQHFPNITSLLLILPHRKHTTIWLAKRPLPNSRTIHICRGSHGFPFVLGCRCREKGSGHPQFKLQLIYARVKRGKIQEMLFPRFILMCRILRFSSGVKIGAALRHVSGIRLRQIFQTKKGKVNRRPHLCTRINNHALTRGYAETGI